MKKNLITIILLVIVLIAVGFIFGSSPSKDGTGVGKNSVVQKGDLIVDGSYESKTLTEDDPYVTFDIKYPYFTNADVSFNSQIEDLIKTKMEDHRKASQDYWQARYDTQEKGDNFPKIPAKEEDKLSFFSDFTIVQSNPFYISFVLKYGGFSGGAHGYEINKSFAYDVQNQKAIELKDLFPNDTEYLTYLSNASRKYLDAQFATVSEEDKKNSDPEAIASYIKGMTSAIEDGTKPINDNFSVFTFTPDKIKIYFAQYQVGPYSIGMPEVEINRE